MKQLLLTEAAIIGIVRPTGKRVRPK